MQSLLRRADSYVAIRHIVVKFELFELRYWLELRELYYNKMKFIKSKMQIIYHNYKLQI